MTDRPADELHLSIGITLRQLQIFVATAEAGSITQAAERLYLSQTAVSLALRQLEKELGATLLVRRRAHGISLTNTGRSLLPLGRNILASAAEFSRTGRQEDEVTGAVRVGCYPSLGPALLPGLIMAFRDAHPEASLEFVEAPEGELMSQLEVGSVDLVLCYRLGVPEGLSERVLEEGVPGVLISSDHPLAQGRDRVHLADLLDSPYIMLDSPIAANHAQTIFAVTGSHPRVEFRSKNFETIRSLAGRGLGWSITLQRPKSPLTHEGTPVSILRIADEGVDAVPVVAVSWPGYVMSRAATAFLEVARQHIRQAQGPDDVLGHHDDNDDHDPRVENERTET